MITVTFRPNGDFLFSSSPRHSQFQYWVVCPKFSSAASLVDLGLVGDAMAIVFTVWLVNLYNFMDGIDGIAAVEALCIAGSVFVIYVHWRWRLFCKHAARTCRSHIGVPGLELAARKNFHGRCR